MGSSPLAYPKYLWLESYISAAMLFNEMSTVHVTLVNMYLYYFCIHQAGLCILLFMVIPCDQFSSLFVSNLMKDDPYSFWYTLYIWLCFFLFFRWTCETFQFACKCNIKLFRYQRCPSQGLWFQSLLRFSFLTALAMMASFILLTIIQIFLIYVTSLG